MAGEGVVAELISELWVSYKWVAQAPKARRVWGGGRGGCVQQLFAYHGMVDIKVWARYHPVLAAANASLRPLQGDEGDMRQLMEYTDALLLQGWPRV